VALKIGLHTGQQDCTYEELSSLWRFADSSGFYWISVWDHHFESPPVDGTHPAFETIAIMTALALETTNVRVGCLVFSPAYRNPALLAKAICTIDHISGGRVEVGLGAGWHEPEYKAFGYPFPRAGVREDMLEETAQIVRAMLRDGKATFHGEHFHVEDAYCVPAPVQKDLRIWIGGGGERRTIPAAAKYADAWNAPYASPEAYANKASILDEACRRIGRDPASMGRAVNLGFYIGVDERDAESKRQHLPWTSADPRFGGLLTGTPSQAVERMGQYADAGAEQINLAIRAPFDHDSLQAFVEQVMPAFA
jgi:alkanesulfonate monooxygenase SsuD/methylene tetrahydromethanopterin reductase-like flavin-dependent oxidoreductase (luciferase family)